MFLHKTMWFLLLLLVGGCAPTSLEDLRLEGEAEVKKLAAELRSIETKEELERARPRLKRRFDRLADLLVRVRKLPSQEAWEEGEAGELLFAEMARLYEIPGAREVVESAQGDAVRRLGLSSDDSKR